LALLCLALAGCIEARVQIRLAADGSGSRHVEMVWKEGTLEDLELTQDDVRELLGLSQDRGWTVRTEERPVQDGSLEPHVVFKRSIDVASVEEWAVGASDLKLRASLEGPAGMYSKVSVEKGRGAGYRTIAYHECIDGREVRDLLNGMAADYFVQKLAARKPDLAAAQLSEIRGLFTAHLSHYAVWALEDEDADAAWDALADHVAPQLADVFAGDAASPEGAKAARTLLDEISESEEINERLERALPGLSLIAFMNLKLEIAIPGAIVQSNADRTGEGYAAWERPLWSAIAQPLDFRVRARIPD
jgi:hypothetical protein